MINTNHLHKLHYLWFFSFFSDVCPKPEIPHSSRIGGRLPPYKLSHFIDYKCDTGYTMKGESHIVCTENGWNPKPPECIGKNIMILLLHDCTPCYLLVMSLCLKE